MNMPNQIAAEGTFKATVEVGGENHPFNAQTVSIRGPGSQWHVSAQYKSNGLLLVLELFIDKTELPDDGTEKTFDLSAANGRKAYGKCGYFKDGGSSYDMLSNSGSLKITYNKSSEKMTGSFNFGATNGGLVASVTDGAFSLTGFDLSVLASGSVAAEISSEEPKEFISTTVKLSNEEAPTWLCWAEQMIQFPFHRSTLSVFLTKGTPPGTYDFAKHPGIIRAIYTKVTPAGNSYNATEGEFVLTTGPAKNELTATFFFTGESIDGSLPSIQVTKGTINIRASKNQ
ncbi:hypothetical protein [Pseudomonas lini]|uniref:hypothetical protein n=1 Tax=Pseudomonas lini TaxID=163011 RepID=UPI00345E78DA